MRVSFATETSVMSGDVKAVKLEIISASFAVRNDVPVRLERGHPMYAEDA